MAFSKRRWGLVVLVGATIYAAVRVHEYYERLSFNVILNPTWSPGPIVVARNLAELRVFVQNPPSFYWSRDPEAASSRPSTIPLTATLVKERCEAKVLAADKSLGLEVLHVMFVSGELKDTRGWVPRIATQRLAPPL